VAKKNLENLAEYSQDSNNTMSGLCIKHNRPTNYSYNKENPDFPYCKTSLTCIYKNKVGDHLYCSYFSQNK
jgi:hypothetical protein